MPLCQQPVITFSCAAEDPAGWTMAEPQAAYKPRHPERTGFNQLLETHFDSYVRAYEERYETRSGSLRPVVVRSVEAFLDCGRLQGFLGKIGYRESVRNYMPITLASPNAIDRLRPSRLLWFLFELERGGLPTRDCCDSTGYCTASD